VVNPGLSRRDKPTDRAPADATADESSRVAVLLLLPAIGWYALLLTAGGGGGRARRAGPPDADRAGLHVPLSDRVLPVV
jgi:hypothetical protein